MQTTNNLRIKNIKALASPALVLDELPITQNAANTIKKARTEASDILHGKNDRLLVIVGPCSIHNPGAAIEYAKLIKQASEDYSDTLHLIMRVYFEKPRTTVGWKGLINDPDLDGSFHINKGLYTARQLLLDINTLGVATGSEFLDTIIPQYISDLTAWSAIGARTTESQIHRELASGLSMPLGFKNSTTGNIQVAVDAAYAATQPHNFLGVSQQGIAAIVSTTGNSDCHIILRGSQTGTNYDAETITEATASLDKVSLSQRVMIDCSHGNSQKDHNKQVTVAESLCEQLIGGSISIFGVMLESNLVAGRQNLGDKSDLTYGQSITDACVDWEQTTGILDKLADAVTQRRQTNKR